MPLNYPVVQATSIGQEPEINFVSSMSSSADVSVGDVTKFDTDTLQ